MATRCTFDLRADIPDDRHLDLSEERTDPKWPEDYTLTPESIWQRFESNSEESTEQPGWRCPHDPISDDRCVFHLDPDEYQQYGVTPALVRDRFLEAIQREEPRYRQFFGATFKRLDLSQRDIRGPHNYPIDLHYVTVAETLDLSDAIVSLPLRAPGICVEGCLDLDDTIFNRDISFFKGQFPGVVSAIDGQFVEARFRGADFRTDDDEPTRVQFQWVQFGEYAEFTDAIFDTAVFHDVDAEEFHLANATVGTGHFDHFLVTDELDLTGVTADTLNFTASTIHRIDLSGATLQSATPAASAEWHDYSVVDSTLEFTDSSIDTITAKGITVDGFGVGFEDPAIADQTGEPGQPAGVKTTGMTTGPLSLEHIEGLSRARVTICFERATVSEGTLEISDPFLTADFTEATIGPLDVEGLVGRAFGDRIVFWKTRFEGFDFSRYHEQLEATSWHICPDERRNGTATADRGVGQRLLASLPSGTEDEPVPSDPGFDGRILTYLRAKNGANEMSDNVAASQFFIKEMVYKQQRHWKLIGSTTGKQRRSHVIACLRNAFLRITSKYGERASYTVIVGFFTVGSWIALSTRFRLLDGFTGLLESFFVALAVFSLTRSIYR
ncbi:pentapeptide repeat-containing protein [Halorubrum distributum]|uniref:pentapeptide repeat-containing protein n=1 Tax=Halorubrum distributum TaxID=29283 RepID=UPI000677B76D|nr:pentapeptide repeat-containing protein [Halorubrum terrestre]